MCLVHACNRMRSLHLKPGFLWMLSRHSMSMICRCLGYGTCGLGRGFLRGCLFLISHVFLCTSVLEKAAHSVPTGNLNPERDRTRQNPPPPDLRLRVVNQSTSFDAASPLLRGVAAGRGGAQAEASKGGGSRGFIGGCGEPAGYDTLFVLFVLFVVIVLLCIMCIVVCMIMFVVSLRDMTMPSPPSPTWKRKQARPLFGLYRCDCVIYL